MSNRAKFANIVLGSIIILFLLMFFYAFSRSNLHPPGHMIKYYIFSITGFFFFTYVLLKCNIELKVKMALLMLSTILSIYAIELILSHNKRNNAVHNRAKLAEDLGIPYDSRYRVEVVMDYQNKGLEAYPLYNPISNINLKGSEISPLAFISGKTIIDCNESGEYIVYKSDEHGFNNPEGLYDDNNNTGIVLLGDSFTHGICVKREDNIAGNLSKTGQKVLNLGMQNSGPLNQLAILKEYGKPLRPRVVLWFFYEGNDHEGVTYEKESPVLLKYLDSKYSQDLINKQKMVDQLLVEYMDKEFDSLREKEEGIAEKIEEINGAKEKAAFNISRSTIRLIQLRKRLGLLGKCECKSDPLFKDIFSEAKNIINGWGGQLFFVYLPEWSRYSEKIDRCRIRYLNTGKDKVLLIINDLQIPIIDIQSIFDSHPDPLSLFPFRIYGHYNADGYALIAKHIEKYLSNNRKNTRAGF
jgi:hypothetical protein